MVVALFGIVFTKAFKDVSTELSEQPSINQSARAVNALEKASKGTKYLDYLFLFLFIGMTLGLIISSLFIKVHPAFFVLFLIGWFVVVALSAIFANIYTEVTNQSELAPTAATFSYTNMLMPKLPWLMFVVGLITIIVIYGKARSQRSETSL